MWEDFQTVAGEAWRALCSALGVQGTRPGAVLESALARVKTVLSASRSLPAPPGETVRFLRTELRRISSEVLDIEPMARGVLWRHWGTRTTAERTAFVPLFADLLERLYVAHVLQLRWATIVPAGEMVDVSVATVTWKVKTLDAVGVVQFRLRRRGRRWKIYDFLLNGRSFVAACREEFDQSIRASSYAAFIRELPKRDHAGFVGPGTTLTAASAQ